MSTLKDLSAHMNAVAEGLEEKASRYAISAAITIVQHLAFNTPVDVSTALSGWQIGLGTPVSLRRLAFYQGMKGSTYQASAQTTVRDAETRLKAKVPGQVIYVSNLEPYVSDLNRGSSIQSPGAFVEVSIILARSQLRDGRIV